MKYYVCFILTAVVLFGTVILSSNYEIKKDQLSVTKNEVNYNQERYILKTKEGHLTVFRSGEKTPFLVTETMSDNLPLEDQKNLENGIEIKGDTALRKSLEDYCS